MDYNNQKKGNGILISLLVILLIVGAFFGGFFVKGLMKEENKEEKKDNIKEDKKDNIPVSDMFIFAHNDIYFIKDGNLYHYNIINSEETNKWGYDVFSLTHSGCIYDGSSSYCQNNSGYNKTATKIEGISNVKRLKLYNRAFATDESFTVYAITEDGNIYSISNKTVEKFLGNNDVEDMLAQNDHSYEILLKNGKHMIYSWQYKEGSDYEMESTYIEKK